MFYLVNSLVKFPFYVENLFVVFEFLVVCDKTEYITLTTKSVLVWVVFNYFYPKRVVSSFRWILLLQLDTIIGIKKRWLTAISTGAQKKNVFKVTFYTHSADTPAIRIISLIRWWSDDVILLCSTCVLILNKPSSP